MAEYVARPGAYEKLVRGLAAMKRRPVTEEEERDIEAANRRDDGLEPAPAVCTTCGGKPPAGFTCQACGAPELACGGR
jgi:hypothetical protein